MKSNFFFLFILCCLQCSFAQQGEHIIKLSVTKPLGIKTFFFDDIIDRRIVKSNIGFVRKGVANHTVTAVFPDEFTAYFGHILQKMCGEQNGEGLVLIVHEFNISEVKLVLSDKSVFRYQLEIAREINDQYYSLWYSEGVVEEKGLDAKIKHSDLIKTELRNIIIDFYRSDWEQIKGDPIYLDSSLAFDYTAKYKNGLYSSFYHLCKNEPYMEEDYKLVRNRNKDPKYILRDSLYKKMKKRVMYIVKDEYIYISASRYVYGNYYVKSKMKGRYIYFEDNYSDLMVSAMLGLVGAALSNSTKAIVLDTQTGLVTALDNVKIKKFLKDYPEILDKYNNSREQISDKKVAIAEVNDLLN